MPEPISIGEKPHAAATCPTDSCLNLSDYSISISLEPIRTFGLVALDAHGQPDLDKVTLRRLQIARETTLHEVLTIASDDLLKPQNNFAAASQSIPPDGTLAAATFDFHFTDCDRPHAVELRPPGTIQLQFPTDARRVLAWLTTSRFRLAHQFANTATLFLLALATAFAPAFADGDDDDDDPDTDRLTCCAP